MDYTVAIPPDLGIDSAAFVAAWNECAECRAAAEARLERAPDAQYDPNAVALAVLSGIALGVAGNAAYDLLKALVPQVLRAAGVLAPVRVEPAGPGLTVLVVVVVSAEVAAPDRRDQGSQ